MNKSHMSLLTFDLSTEVVDGFPSYHDIKINALMVLKRIRHKMATTLIYD